MQIFFSSAKLINANKTLLFDLTEFKKKWLKNVYKYIMFTRIRVALCRVLKFFVLDQNAYNKGVGAYNSIKIAIFEKSRSSSKMNAIMTSQ